MLYLLAGAIAWVVLFWLAKLDKRVETIEGALIDCAGDIDDDHSNLTRGG